MIDHTFNGEIFIQKVFSYFLYMLYLFILEFNLLHSRNSLILNSFTNFLY